MGIRVERDIPKLEEMFNQTIPRIPQDNLLPYREYANLAVFPINSRLEVEAIGYIKHYGKERLIVSVRGNMFQGLFQGGEDLESKIAQLSNGCCIQIEKIKTNRNRKVKYAVCSVYKREDCTDIGRHRMDAFVGNLIHQNYI